MIAPIRDKTSVITLVSVTVITGDMDQTYLFTTFDKASSFYDKRVREWKKSGVKLRRNKDFDHAHSSDDAKHLIYLFTGEPVY